MILAILDRRTCEICGDQDTNHYKIKDAKIGINMPLFHPNCRCTTTVYFEDDDLPGERMMRDENGKSVKTDYMSFDEWKKKYVDKVDENGYNIDEEFLQEKFYFIDQYTNEKSFIPRGAVFGKTKTIYSGTGIKTVQKLIDKYGGESKDWEKRVGKIDSAKYTHDIHWYELDGKQYDVKFKFRKEK